jgi:hypothetical protein
MKMVTLLPFSIKILSHLLTSMACLWNSLVCLSRSELHLFRISSMFLLRRAAVATSLDLAILVEVAAAVVEVAPNATDAAGAVLEMAPRTGLDNVAVVVAVVPVVAVVAGVEAVPPKVNPDAAGLLTAVVEAGVVPPKVNPPPEVADVVPPKVNPVEAGLVVSVEVAVLEGVLKENPDVAGLAGAVDVTVEAVVPPKLKAGVAGLVVSAEVAGAKPNEGFGVVEAEVAELVTVDGAAGAPNSPVGLGGSVADVAAAGAVGCPNVKGDFVAAVVVWVAEVAPPNKVAPPVVPPNSGLVADVLEAAGALPNRPPPVLAAAGAPNPAVGLAPPPKLKPDATFRAFSLSTEHITLALPVAPTAPLAPNAGA